jgi:site-specific DNA-methyltransferase (adenine-specific)
VKDPTHYTFNYDEIERIPYMAPGLVGAEKAAKGKIPTDTWWHTIVPTNGKEKTGYPTQKPLGVIRRIISASSNPGETVLDFFAGSGTTGAACLELGRRFILVDSNPQALETMAKRFAGNPEIEWIGYEPKSNP